MVELIVFYSNDLPNEQIINLATSTDEELLEWLADLLSHYCHESQTI